MTTKENIVDEALSLFSINGYNGTSVKSIANAVGIRDSSLYKHFHSKRDILNTIVNTIKIRIENMSEVFGLPPDGNIEKATLIYAAFDENMLVEFSKKVFLFYLKDSYISRFWRMGNIEQYQNNEIYTVFHKVFLEDSITYQASLFEQLTKKNVFISCEPQVIAINYYAPIFFLISKYANNIENESEALIILEKQVREFYRIYKK